jgi:hypothetical protein
MPGNAGVWRRGADAFVEANPLPPVPAQAAAEQTLIAPANSGITEAQLAAMSPKERAQVLQAENDYRNFTRGFGQEYYGPIAGAADVLAAPVKLGYNSLAALGNLIGLPRVARAFGLAPRDAGDIPYATNFTQFTSGVKEWGERRAPLTAKQMRGRPEKPPAEAEEEKAAEEELKDVPKGPVANSMNAPAGVRASGGTGGSSQAAASGKPPTAFYAGKPDRIVGDRYRMEQAYQRTRSRLYAQAEAALVYGESSRAEPYLQQIEQLDASYAAGATLLEGMAALTMCEFGNDPRAISEFLSNEHLGGTPVDIQARTDGLYDLHIGGQPQGTYGMADITDMVRQLFDQTYRETTTARKATYSMEAFKSQLATNAKLTEIEAQMLADMAVESIKGRVAMQIANTSAGKIKVALDSATNTAIVWSDTAGVIGRLDMLSNVTEETPAGEITIPPAMQYLYGAR